MSDGIIRFHPNFKNQIRLMKNPETTSHVIKVAIADDHTLFRSGVKA